MIRAYTADQVREAEKPLLKAGIPLMQRASAGLAAHISALLRDRRGRVPGSRVVILAGPGANGGDGLHAGALLAARGAHVVAIATGDRLHEGGAAALRRRGGRLLEVEGAAAGTARADVSGAAGGAVRDALARADVILDAILGIGGRPQLEAPLAQLIAAAQDAAARGHGPSIVAVDVPTGLDATTGQAADGAVRADLTVTFGAVKTGLLMPGARACTGAIELVGIGLGPQLPEQAPVERLEAADAAALWPVPGPTDHKYSRGVVTIDAGSEEFPGAAVLCVSGAARTGPGMIRYRGPRAVLDLVLQRRPEVVGAEGRRQALVVGSGLSSEDPRAEAGAAELAEPDAVGVIDAGALGAISSGQRFGPSVVLTPHAGEAARLADALGLADEESEDGRALRDDPAALALAIARETGATVLLKGAVTLVADETGHLYSQDDATSCLATAGAGDVLAGILGTLLAAGIDAGQAAALAAMVHGRASVEASRGGLVPICALDVADSVPDALATILGPAIEGPRDHAPAGRAVPMGPSPRQGGA